MEIPDRVGSSSRLPRSGRPRCRSDFGYAPGSPGRSIVRARLASEFHDVPHRASRRSCRDLRRRGTADLVSAGRIIPEIVVVRDQLERRGQSEIVAVVVQQLEAKGVNGAEEARLNAARLQRTRCSRIFCRARCCISSAARLVKVTTTRVGNISRASGRARSGRCDR